jgi:hypothetical protein
MKIAYLRNSKRGSISVFLVVVFACMITIAAVLFAGAKASAGRSMTDASLQLAGRSVLSEYDRRLLSDYGLIAFRGDEERIEDAITYYAEASLSPKNPLYLLFRGGGERTISQNTKCQSVTANLKGYSLLDLDIFESQIESAVLSELFGSLGGRKKEFTGSANGKTSRDDGYGRCLRDRSVIATLPSHGFTSPTILSFGGISDITNSENLVDSGKSIVAVSEYVFSIFGNHVDGAKEDHFFGNEVEYLIAGKFDDEANYSDVKGRIVAMRLILNNISIATDSKKMGIINTLALASAAVSGESLYEVFKIAYMEAWVAAETANDIKLLENGDKVALHKTPSHWATQNLEEIIKGISGTKIVYPANKGGQTYKDYLRIMLAVLDRETKYLRMMDLMQINLKGTYYEEFLMREHYVGYRFSCIVDGDTYAYEEKY